MQENAISTSGLVLKIGKIVDGVKIGFLLIQVLIYQFLSSSHLLFRMFLTEAVNFLRERYSVKDKFLDRLEFFNVTFSGTYDE